MDLLLATFDGTLTQALIVGSLVGAIAGITTFTATSAGERTHYIIVGALGAGLLVAVYQGLQLASFWGVDLLAGTTSGTAGAVLLTSFVRIAGAAFLGGILTLAFVAPGRAVLGALGGIIVGVIASVILWFVLDWLGETIPVLLYGLAVLAIMLFMFESISRA